MDYCKQLSLVSDRLLKDYDVIIDTNTVIKNKKHVGVLPDYAHAAYHAFYGQIKEVNIKWLNFKFEKLPNVCGKINILPAEKVFSDWEGIVWFKGIPETYHLKDFKVLDFFVNEACVGFYNIEGKTEELHYLYFEEEPVPLGINLEGYCQLLSLSYGFFYWQSAIVELITKKKSQESKDFKRYMPKLFSDFSYPQFVEVYNQVRIKKT